MIEDLGDRIVLAGASTRPGSKTDPPAEQEADSGTPADDDGAGASAAGVADRPPPLR